MWSGFDTINKPTDSLPNFADLYMNESNLERMKTKISIQKIGEILLKKDMTDLAVGYLRYEQIKSILQVPEKKNDYDELIDILIEAGSEN